MTVRHSRAAGVAGAAGMIAAVTLVARAVGFGRWLVFSHAVGSTCVGEVYGTANQLPNVLYEVAAGGALAAVVVPLVAEALDAGDRPRADAAARAMLTWAVTILLPLAVLLAAAAGPLSRAMIGDGGAGCDGEGARALGATMIVVFAPQVLLYGIGITLSGILQAHRRFFAAALAPLLSSIVVIASYAAYGQLAQGLGARPNALSAAAITALAGGTTLGVAALSLPLLVPVRRAGVRLGPTWHFPLGMGRRAAHLAAAGIVALAAQQIAVLVTIWVANHRGTTGSVNVYTYVQAMYQLPYAVLAVPLAMSAFPHLVGRSHAVFEATLPAVVAAGAVGAALLVAVAGPATGFFEALDASRHGGSSPVPAMEAATIAYACGLPGFCLIALLLRTAYAAGRAWPGGLTVAGGWLLSAVLPPVLLAGAAPSARTALSVLGWCSALGMTVAAAGLAVIVGRCWGPAVLRPAGRTLVVSVVGATLAAAAGSGLGHALSPHGLGASAGVVVASAFVTILIFAAALHLGDPVTDAHLRRAVRSRLPGAAR